MSTIRLLLVAGLLAISPSPAFASVGHVWLTDLEPALAEARIADKELFVYFTGSDWCKYCILLEREVFAEEGYLDRISEKYVLVKLDFPNRGGETYRAMSKDLLKRNYVHKAEFGVDGPPTILIMSPDRWVVGRLGYAPGGVPVFERQLQSVERSRDEVLGAYEALYRGSDGEAEQRLAAAYKLQSHPNLRSDDRSKILEVVRAYDSEDRKLVLAYAALEDFAKQNLVARSASWQPDWLTIHDVLQELLERQASVERVAEFHAYRAMALAWKDDDAASAAAVERASDLGMSNRMALWLDGHLKTARENR